VEPRTLQRKLHSMDLDFSSLVDGVRHEYSDFLLAETTVSITDIGSKLGYSSSASYARAAQTWYGMSASSKRATRH
jgi:AraC-like DNA-binding protein